MKKIREEQRNILVRQVFLSLFFVALLRRLIDLLCVLVDNIMIGQFLGEKAVIAAGLKAPVVIILSVITGLLETGTGVMCSRHMGRADMNRANRVFSAMLFLITVMTFVTAVCLFTFAPELTTVLCAKTKDPQILEGVRGYLLGYAFALVPEGMSSVLGAIMVIDSDQHRALFATALTLTADIILDLANGLVFHGGMFGMAMATAVSSMLGLVVYLFHFRKPEHVIHFSLKHMEFGAFSSVAAAGLIIDISLGIGAVSGILYNHMLIDIAGSDAVASYYVGRNSFRIVLAAFLAVLSATASLSGLFYGEEDVSSLIKTWRTSLRTAAMIAVVFIFFYALFAEKIAAIFIPNASGEVMKMSVRFIWAMLIKNCLSAFTYCFSGIMIGTGRYALNNKITVIREAIYGIPCILIPAMLFGLPGFEIALAGSGFLNALTVFLLPSILNRRKCFRIEDYLLLPDDFGPLPEEIYETEIVSEDDVEKASIRVREFCLSRGEDQREAFLFSLFTEEMGGNIVRYGFKGAKEGAAQLRIIYSENTKKLRFRDNGIPFDPLAWYEMYGEKSDRVSSCGIKIVLKEAAEVQYVPTLKMNHTIIHM